MSKVLFFNIPSHGHMNPTLPLVAELVRRGEQVIYYSSPGFQQAIEATGATFRDSVTLYVNDQTQISENMLEVARMLLEASHLAIPMLLPEAREERPDYIMFDSLCPWGNYIAQILDIPAICSTTTFAVPALNWNIVTYLFKHPSDFQLFRGSTSDELPRMLFEGRTAFARFNALATLLHKKYHIAKPQLSMLGNSHAPMEIVFTTRQFQPFIDLFDDRYKFVGPSILPRSHDDSFPFDELTNAPIIYISLGTVFSSNGKENFYRTCFEAFADSDKQVVLAVGSRTNIAALGPIPANFIVRGFVPQLELLQRATLFITHGGMNSVSEALCYNVPLLVIPQTADQYMVGTLIEQLEAGKKLRKKYLTAQAMRQMADEILAQPVYQRASTSIGTSLRASKGYLNGANEIARFKEQHAIV